MRLLPILFTVLIALSSVALSSPGQKCDNRKDSDDCDRGEKCLLSNCYTLVPTNGKCGGEYQICHAAEICQDNVCVEDNSPITNTGDTLGDVLDDLNDLMNDISSLGAELATTTVSLLEDLVQVIFPLFQTFIQNGGNITAAIAPILHTITPALEQAISGA